MIPSVALPPGVPLLTVYTDFMGYLLNHTRSFFQDRILDGPHIWDTYSKNMTVAFINPEGWSVREQAFLRKSFQDVEPRYSGCNIRSMSEGEAYALGFTSSTNDLHKVASVL
jgi:hypothetical protein